MYSVGCQPNYGVLDHVSRFACAPPGSGPSFSQSTEDLAETTRKQGCPCGGRLHSANYPRKPRGTPRHLPEAYRLRLSFCCDRDGCRKRVTPPSVRFLGRKVYLAAIVILISAMRQGPIATPGPRAVRYASAPTGGPSRAGRSSGANAFPRHPFWKIARARLVPHDRHRRPALRPARRLPQRGRSPLTGGSGCSASSHRSRSREPCESRSPDDRLRPAEDAPSLARPAGV